MFNKIQKYESSFSNNDDQITFGEVLRSLRAISTIRSVKVDYTEGANKSHPLKFDPHANISYGRAYSNIEQKYIHDMTNQRCIYNLEDYNIIINNIVKEKLGFSIDSIYKIVEKIQSTYFLGDDFLAGDRQSWCEVFEQMGNCDSEEARAVFEYFTYSTLGIDLFGNQSRKNDRIMRRPLILIDNTAYCTVNNLSLALIGLHNDIIDGEINDDEIKKELDKVYKQINHDFEDKVYNEIKTILKNFMIKKNVNEKDLLINKKKQLLFPGEIDILLLYNNNLFVIECKNFNLKIDAKAMANEFGKLTKFNSNSIQGKLDKKVNWIKENFLSVIDFMGGDCSLEYNEEPIGVITTSAFSLVSQEKDIKFPVVTWTNLCEWIQKQ